LNMIKIRLFIRALSLKKRGKQIQRGSRSKDPIKSTYQWAMAVKFPRICWAGVRKR
jgi:hypothetical protein